MLHGTRGPRDAVAETWKEIVRQIEVKDAPYTADAIKKQTKERLMNSEKRGQ